jgi:hypothetical protein
LISINQTQEKTMKFQEPNTLNLKRGDYVIVRLAHPETATIDEITTDYTHAGEVRRVYHNENGILRVEIEGLEAKLGRNWTWQNRILSVDSKPSIFETDEQYVEVSIFDISTAGQRSNCRNFRGDVNKINAGEYEVYSFDSGNSYVVKVEKTDSYIFRTGCTCADFTNRLRVCKHISHIFSGKSDFAFAIAA